MKQALFWDKAKPGFIQCLLCPHNCVIGDGGTGICGARRNLGGVLNAMNYGRPASMGVDPIEKKPLFHFLPGSLAFSFGTYGCNLSCANCQNFELSMARDQQPDDLVAPEDIVRLAIKNRCQAIAYTYNEPTIFYEYMLDCAKLAREQGIKNVMVSNGYINPEPLAELCKFIDAANIDLKSMDESFYKSNCKARLAPVLESLKLLKQKKVWLEITMLIIPTLNDSPEEIEKIAKWIAAELGKDVPFHLSAFSPTYKLSHLPPTPLKTLLNAKETAGKYLDFVYVGNVAKAGLEDTLCPKCKTLLVRRQGFYVAENEIADGKCPKCGKKIAGVWDSTGNSPEKSL